MYVKYALFEWMHSQLICMHLIRRLYGVNLGLVVDFFFLPPLLLLLDNDKTHVK